MRARISAWRSARTRRELRRDHNNENKTGIIASAGYTAEPVSSKDQRQTEFVVGTTPEGVRNPEAQSRIQVAMKRGVQTRDAETDLARVLGDLADRR